MLRKTIIIDGKEVEFKASASTPRMYRIKFRRDIMQDMAKLKGAYSKNQIEGAEFEIIDLEIFENVAFIMAKQADNTIHSEITDWLDQFNMFSIYVILPEIIDLWRLNEESMIDSKKNLIQVVAGK